MITTTDYQNMLARAAAKTRNPAPSTAEPLEAPLHDFILQECRRRGWLCFHGSMAHRTKRTKGEQDFTIMADGGRVLFIECKGRTTKTSTEQAGVHAMARKLGHEVHVVRSRGQVLEVMSALTCQRQSKTAF